MPTKIEWCDETINPVVGCSKCSPGCDNCYAEKMAYRLSKMPHTAEKYAGVVDEAGRWSGKISRMDLSVFDKLPKNPCSVFVGSMTDIFYDRQLQNTPSDLWRRFITYPEHQFLLLTKRPENMREFIVSLSRYWLMMKFTLAPPKLPLKNVWLGATICNQKEADEKIPVLTSIDTVAAHRFLSIEPMLGPINLRFGDSDHLPSDTEPFQERHHLIRGVIVGGETGPRARPINPDWVRSVRDQCSAAGVPFFFKGWGKGYLFSTDADGHEKKYNSMRRVDEGNIDRFLDGVEHNERPW